MNAARQHMLDFHYPPTMPETELAYLAGIVDGEGTVTILRTAKSCRGRPKRDILQPQLSIYTTSEELVSWLQGRGFRIFCRDRRQEHSTSYNVAIWGYKVHGALVPLLPYLVIKKEHAATVIRFIEERANHPSYNQPYTETELSLWTVIQRLNWKRSFPFAAHFLRFQSTTSQPARATSSPTAS